MGRFDRDGASRRGRDFGRRSYDSQGSGRPHMYSAICSNCGKACEVPFRPNGSKPVYCNDCFQNNRGSEVRNFDSRNSSENFRRPRFENNAEYGNKNREHDHFNKQFAQLNAKLDTILTMLKPVGSKSQEQESTVPAVETAGAEEAVVATVTEEPMKPQEEEHVATPAKKKKATKKKATKKE